MRLIRYILIPLGLAVPLSQVSCLVERPGADDPGKKSRTVVFTLSNSGPAACSTRGVTRAIEDPTENEQAIERLDVFFYGGDGELLYYPELSQLEHDAATKRVTITIPEDTYVNTLADETCTIYLVANAGLPRASLVGLSLAALEDVVMENGDGWLFNRTAAPGRFLMTGSASATILADNQNLGKIILRRAAAKIVVDISNAAVEGYTPGEARVRISNYVDKTRLGAETAVATADDYKTSEFITMNRGGEGENLYTIPSESAFYSYYNDWSADTDGTTETYITLELEWTPEGTISTEPTVYYYRIPFSYINAGENAGLHKDRIRRNYVYQFMVDVSELGGIDPEDAVDLAANFDVIDWTDREVEVSILSYHYLFVYNSRMQIYEQSWYEWEYRSSLDIDIDVTGVECMQYFPDGSSATVTYEEGDLQYPVITKREADGMTFFRADAMVPVNYVPLEISLTVSNGAQLYSNAHLTIFPKEYVTAGFSNGGTNQNTWPDAGAYGHPTRNDNNGTYGSNNPDGHSSSGQTNFNFYKITTVSLADRVIMIGDTRQKVLLGDPSRPAANPFGNLNPYNVDFIETDPSKNHIVSPAFIMASQRGITANNRGWEPGWERCRRYREAQYPAGTWRVPTFAELAMLGDMQNDPNSAIKDLFITTNSTNPGWWTALEEWKIRVNVYRYATGAGVYEEGTASVRCVHDTWKDQ